MDSIRHPSDKPERDAAKRAIRQAPRSKPMQRGFGEVTLDQLRAEQKESPFQAQIVERAQRLGWRCLLVRPVRIARADGSVRYETAFGGDGKGWPDLFLAREVVLWRELKKVARYPTPEQRAWRDALTAAGQSWAVWRPTDDDAILRQLSHRWIAGAPPTMRRCRDPWCCEPAAMPVLGTSRGPLPPRRKTS